MRIHKIKIPLFNLVQLVENLTCDPHKGDEKHDDNEDDEEDDEHDDDDDADGNDDDYDDVITL